MSKLIIQPLGGLANKIRNITSTRVLSKYMGYSHEITTWVEDDSAPGFDTIYKLTNGFQISLNKPEDFTTIKPLNTPFDIDELKKNNNIFMRGHNIVKPKLIDGNEWIKEYQKTLNELELKDEIKLLIPELPNDCIGVQIRRTDNVESIENSLLEDFIRTIKNTPNPIFLCTDDKKIEEQIKTMFGDQIIINEKKGWDNDKIIHWDQREWYINDISKYPYTKEEQTTSLIEAVIDFYTLSKTSKIYGSYWSSYSEEASKINNIELMVVKK